MRSVIFDLREYASRMYGFFDLPKSCAETGHIYRSSRNDLHQLKSLKLESLED
jgi:hypothetical protein